jgi:hypothetical protein
MIHNHFANTWTILSTHCVISHARVSYSIVVSSLVPSSNFHSNPRFLDLCRKHVLHRVLGCPLPRSTIVPDPVRLEQLRNIRYQRIVWVGIRQKGADGKQDLANRQCRTPLVLEDVEANTTVRVDVAVIDSSGEVDLGWLEWIVSGKVNIQKENAPCIWRVVGAHDGCLPVEHIITDGTCRTVRRRVFSQIDQFYTRDRQASKASKAANIRVRGKWPKRHA